MICSRMGLPVTVLRVASVKDFREIERREPDPHEREAIDHASLLVIRFSNDGKERTYHRADLKADGGSIEVNAALGRALVGRAS
jgi:hypothetical protein